MILAAREVTGRHGTALRVLVTVSGANNGLRVVQAAIKAEKVFPCGAEAVRLQKDVAPDPIELLDSVKHRLTPNHDSCRHVSSFRRFYNADRHPSRRRIVGTTCRSCPRVGFTGIQICLARVSGRTASLPDQRLSLRESAPAKVFLCECDVGADRGSAILAWYGDLISKEGANHLVSKKSNGENPTSLGHGPADGDYDMPRQS